MEVKIKKATLDDLPFLEFLEKSCFPVYKRSSRRMLRLSISSPFQEVFIACAGKHKKTEKAGAIIIHFHKKTLRIYSIAVLEQYREQQVGKKLMQTCLDLANSKHFEKISLEAISTDFKLISWYKQFGFKALGELKDYYAEGIHATRMALEIYGGKSKNIKANLIVVDKAGRFIPPIDNIKVVSARTYIASKKYQELNNARVFNLCNSYKYQSMGYYVSLLASARDHRAIPSVTTMGDYQNIPVIKSISTELDELIQKSFNGNPEKEVTLSIYFGQTARTNYKLLGFKLYQLFETPLLSVKFVKNSKWLIQKLKPLNLSKLSDDERLMLKDYMSVFFSKKRFRIPRLKNYKYDLAILTNPEEKNPPSCSKALAKFKEAADKKGFYTEFITKDDINRICEFDVLFIRETTNVNNYTYRFSRLAYAEGLVVIDDPWSILRCSNKIYLYERMMLNKIQMPQSRVLSKNTFKPSDVEGMDFPLVLKQPDGSFSLGVKKVDNVEELQESLKNLFKDSELIIAQCFMPSDYDWRIGILGNEPLFACKYFMAKGHWQIYNWDTKSTDREGNASTLPISEVPEKVLKTAVQAATLIGDGLYGVDLKEINGQVYLIEVNDNPNIDSGVEDGILKNELYEKIMDSFLNRIELSRNISKFIAADPV